MSESEDKPQGQALPERPDEWLNGIAAEAWQAFNAMETTKRRHFSLLEVMDNRKKNYNIDPYEREKAMLAYLLRDHDEQVRRFTESSRELKALDSEAHKALFIYIGEISQDSLTPRVTH
ncbi:hypothetical protein [Granulosicoccus antarcticus]|uniref:Uncharacterized protein n=1 Tax=Granulosicoccus antarcticus IMCC3135 TaxID=1192854 RepID=A0A2Z2NGB3_9GAMM|nr:hypothetical protein [Granulosicoccus antarcticus]ASJ70239.1 hypothetical protein IMCC3135_00565 [Granulosicoccus antarcticus IMCC3135]